MEKKKSIFRKIVLGVSACLIALCAVIPFIPYYKIDAVYADSTNTSATFNSSNLILTRLGFTSSSSELDFGDLNQDWLSNSIYFNFSFKIDYDSSADSITYYIKGQFNDTNYIYGYNSSDVKDTFCDIGTFNLSSSEYINHSVHGRSEGAYYWSPILYNLEYFDTFSNSFIVPNSNVLARPSLIINQIIFGNYTDFSRMNFATNSIFGSHLDNGQYNFVSLIDAKGFRFTYFIPVCPVSSENIINSPANYLTYREYYTSNAINLGDNSAYQQGYQQGLLDNQTNVYDNGYNAGNAAGYGEGYNAGLKDSNQYSFFSLFGAVLDAPISALTGLLNFNLFGVNLLTLFTGLLTLAIILFVLRFIRGGK